MSSVKSVRGEGWSTEGTEDLLYLTKFVTCPGIIDEWTKDKGGLRGKDVLEFGCGEGTMALGTALHKGARRVVGVEVLDVYRQCLPKAQRELGLNELPANLELYQIAPGQRLSEFGQFDVVYSWSVFEHVSQEYLASALQSIKEVLRPGGAFFLQISPLYYSPNGSHLGPWIPEPWAHLRMQHDALHEALVAAAETTAKVRAEWSVYIPLDADQATERAALWETYRTLNKVTAPALRRLAEEAGFTISRDYRTNAEAAIPGNLAEIFLPEVMMTEQIVLLMERR